MFAGHGELGQMQIQLPQEHLTRKKSANPKPIILPKILIRYRNDRVNNKRRSNKPPLKPILMVTINIANKIQQPIDRINKTNNPIHPIKQVQLHISLQLQLSLARTHRHVPVNNKKFVVKFWVFGQ